MIYIFIPMIILLLFDFWTAIRSREFYELLWLDFLTVWYLKMAIYMFSLYYTYYLLEFIWHK